ncbi:TAXI family TRAP transporter solute-binding subunit [Nocardioides sp. YIM B13467]|uniref:TAXI family TRAP transporter solute-binding subunit n=1 Tax=Nocardioides sp. YIM B13467 TaxID=3366294 RepID=UPI00366FE51C
MRTVTAAAVAPTVASLAGCRDPETAPVTIAAGTEYGTYAVFAGLLADQLRAVSPGLEPTVVATEGSLDNVRLLRDGEAALGLALEDGLDRIVADMPEADRPLALARIYENYLHLLVTDDSPIREVDDLRGRRVVLGAAGSGAAVTAVVLLEAAGLRTRDLTVSHTGLAAGLDRLLEDEVDAVFWSGGIPTPTISKAGQRRPLRMIDLGALAAPMSRQSGYRYSTRKVPPVDYGPRSGGTTIGVPNLLLARRDLPHRVAREIVDVMVSRADLLIPDFVRGLQYLEPATMIQTGRIPLHPGALSAYRALHG